MSKRIMKAISASSVRLLISAANRIGISHSDIVDIVMEGDEYVLIYYDESE